MPNLEVLYPPSAECNISFCIHPQLAEYDQVESWRIVDCVLDYIRSTSVKYFTGPSETTLEGPLEQLLDIIAHAQKICIAEGGRSSVSNLKIYYNPLDKLSFTERLHRTTEHRTI